jgi:hypothetical protein
MLLRTFAFRVPKKKERAMAAFMRTRAMRLLRRLPACRAAYFLRNARRRGDYVWVTLWTSDAARARTMQREDWKKLVKEESARFFSGKPKITHYQVLAKR